MKRFNIIKKFNKVNDDFINSFFKEKNISKYKKDKILKNWESSFFLIYYFFINIKDFNNLIKEIKNDNKIYLEEIKNDNLIDL